MRPIIDLDEYRRRGYSIAQAREKARLDYENHAEEEAEADHDYRVAKAKAMAEYRAAGKAQDESLTLAEADAAGHKRRRDMAAVLKTSARFRIEECEGSRANLRVEAEWAQRIDPTG